jgi:CubicO group peptidase (beta-lactamase class C family)
MKNSLWLLLTLFFGQGAFAQTFPADTGWAYQEQPLQKGWNAAKLEQVHKFVVDSTQVTGMMIICEGKVVYHFGDLAENSYIASCRKSVLALLYGKYVCNGRIKLDQTIGSLGIDDIGGLLPMEKTATVRELLQARSGVFHPASYPGDYLKYAPARGSVKPGSFWLYSNWDFNLAGYVFEQQSGHDIYDELQAQLALPLHMQDWNRSLQHKDGDTTISHYKAYPIWLSTRDMARIGLLMLHSGKWQGRQVIDSAWIATLVSPVTSYQEVNKNTPAFRGADFYMGYGYLWWLWQNMADTRFAGGYSALGSMGQTISVFPAINTIIVYKTKDVYERETPYRARFRLLKLSVQAFEPLK